jgi:UDPglucose 6-dehydrogenase
VVVTEWNEFRQLVPAEVSKVATGRIIIDGRNCLDAAAWREAGWVYKGLGRP